MSNYFIKNILAIISILGLLTLNSCDDYLSKNPDNRQKLDTEIKLKKTLTSAYPDASYWMLAEMASDNTDENGSKVYSPHSLIQEQCYRWQEVIGDDVDTPYHIWSKFYGSIMTASAVLEALEDLKAKGKISTNAVADGIEAEARLCRAYAHFILVNLFSKTYGETSDQDLGVPYVTEPEKNLIVHYERGTVKNVYENIEKDLLIALKSVGKIDQKIRQYHWNKEAAYAFAARFYLYYKQYEMSIKYADLALGSNPAGILRNWRKDGANAGNLDLVYDQYIDATNPANFMLVPAESLWGRISGPYKLGLGMAMQDITVREFAPDGVLAFSGSLPYNYRAYSSGALVVFNKVGEYFEYYDKNNGIGWTHIVQALFTADETLLARAEAYALSNDLDKAVKDLDTFARAFTYYRDRGDLNMTASKENLIAYYRDLPYYEPTSFDNVAIKKRINWDGLKLTADQRDVLHPILQARRTLTAHEGLRLFDLNRYGITVYRRKIHDGSIIITDSITMDDPRRVFQIPQQMITAGIQANPR